MGPTLHQGARAPSPNWGRRHGIRRSIARWVPAISLLAMAPMTGCGGRLDQYGGGEANLHMETPSDPSLGLDLAIPGLDRAALDGFWTPCSESPIGYGHKLVQLGLDGALLRHGDGNFVMQWDEVVALMPVEPPIAPCGTALDRVLVQAMGNEVPPVVSFLLAADGNDLGPNGAAWPKAVVYGRGEWTEDGRTSGHGTVAGVWHCGDEEDSDPGGGAEREVTVELTWAFDPEVARHMTTRGCGGGDWF